MQERTFKSVGNMVQPAVWNMDNLVLRVKFSRLYEGEQVEFN